MLLHFLSFWPLDQFQRLPRSRKVRSVDQGARHAEEGVPRAGGDVRWRDAGVPLVRPGESGNAQSRPAGDVEKRLLAGKEGEAAAFSQETLIPSKRRCLTLSLPPPSPDSSA